jgi:hypothetical protein
MHVAWAQAPASPPTRGKLERLVVAVAPLGWDTNFTWLQSRSGMLDKRPALEYLVGIDRNTGAYIPELAEKWGEFTAKDVRHAIFLISQPDSVQTDPSLWRSLMGIGKNASLEEVAKKVSKWWRLPTIMRSSSTPQPLPRNSWIAFQPRATW